ncbi:MAG: hybrid sensor histidine kinase/response regulator [Deltaproteobacteria bacterium]|nr:hybrid sensor histidine kinase/response regulator [Deltaproteobacteria bacterium]
MSDEEVKALTKRVRYLERELRHSQSARARLEDLNERNQLIRTKSNEELNLANAELKAALERLVEAQAQLVQSEKLASLGQLVAGVAHELNTPLGAIRASAENLKTALRSIVDLSAYFARLEAYELTGLQELLEAALAAPALTPRAERQARRRMQQELQGAGVEDADGLATSLIEIGIAGELGPHFELLRRPAAREILKRAYDVVAAVRNSDNIRLAAERASKIVLALKSYAHPGQQRGLYLEAAVTDRLEMVLTLYRSQLKQGVELMRDYEDSGRMWAHHDELDQVWTNLIHNSIQAMGASGVLHLGIASIGEDRLRVNVTDTGPGIPESIQPRIFEPFFTTKAVGEGTGLGLAICRDIVARHGGSLTFQSRPGRTTFSVELPRRAKERST